MDKNEITTYLTLYNAVEEVDKLYKHLNGWIKRYNALSPRDKVLLEDYIDLNEFDINQLNSKWYELAKEVEEYRSSLNITNDSIKRVMITISALLISLYKEDIVEKDSNKNISVIANERTFNELLGTFFKKDKDKVLLGNIVFDSIGVGIDFLRNKLLHGDYEIKNDDIIIHKDSQVGIISFRFLNCLCEVLPYVAKSNGKQLKSDFPVYVDFVKRDEPTTINNIDSKTVLCSYTINIKGKRSIDYEILTLAEKFEIIVKEYILNGKLFRLKEVIDAMQNALAAKKCSLDFQMQDHVKFNSTVIKQIDRKMKKMKTNEFRRRTMNEEYVVRDNRFEFNQADYQNILDSVWKSIGSDKMSDMYFNMLKFLKSYMLNAAHQKYEYDIEDVDIVLKLLKFYSTYIYGLDEITTSRNTTNLKEILIGNKFDYSKLDLDQFYDPSMTMDIKITSYIEQKNKIINDYERIKEILVKKSEELNNYLQKPMVRQEVVEKLEGARDYYLSLYEEQKQLKDKLDDFDVDKYLMNINIIDHIRNCIAHSNYDLIISDNGMEYIKFEDIYEGNNTYSLLISTHKLDELFPDTTMMANYLECLSHEVNEKSSERTILEARLLDERCIKKDKYEEWCNYVYNVLDTEDDSKIRILQFTHELMRELLIPSIDKAVFDEYINTVGHTISTIFAPSTDTKPHQNIRLVGMDLSYDEYQTIIKTIYNYIDNELLIEFIKHMGSNSQYEGSFLNRLVNETTDENTFYSGNTK